MLSVSMNLRPQIESANTSSLFKHTNRHLIYYYDWTQFPSQFPIHSKQIHLLIYLPNWNHFGHKYVIVRKNNWIGCTVSTFSAFNQLICFSNRVKYSDLANFFFQKIMVVCFSFLIIKKRAMKFQNNWM